MSSFRMTQLNSTFRRGFDRDHGVAIAIFIVGFIAAFAATWHVIAARPAPATVPPAVRAVAGPPALSI